MRIGGKRTWLVLAGLLLAGYAAYEIGTYWLSKHYLRAAQEALERRDFAAARLHLEKSLNVRENQPAVRLLAAQTARRQGDFEEALRQLRLCKPMNVPREALILEHQLLALQQGDLAEGERLFSNCVHRPEARETPLILEAFIEGHLRRLTALGPYDAEAPGGEKEQTALSLGRTRQAIELWLQQCPGQADQAQGLFWRGQTHRLGRDYPKAIADCRQVLALNPEHFEARLLLATALAQTSLPEAFPHLEQLHERDPANERVRLLLARAHRALGHLDDARKLLDEILASRADHAPALVERGRLSLDIDRPADAESYLRRALEKNPDDPQALLKLVEALQHQGKTAEAEHYQERLRKVRADRQRHDTSLNR